MLAASDTAAPIRLAAYVPWLNSHAAQKPRATMPTEIWFAVTGVRISSRLIGSEMRRLKRASTPSVGLKMAHRSELRGRHVFLPLHAERRTWNRSRTDDAEARARRTLGAHRRDPLRIG